VSVGGGDITAALYITTSLSLAAANYRMVYQSSYPYGLGYWWLKQVL